MSRIILDLQVIHTFFLTHEHEQYVVIEFLSLCYAMSRKIAIAFVAYLHGAEQMRESDIMMMHSCANASQCQ